MPGAQGGHPRPTLGSWGGRGASRQRDDAARPPELPKGLVGASCRQGVEWGTAGLGILSGRSRTSQPLP